jgi:hypothetical protein
VIRSWRFALPELMQAAISSSCVLGFAIDLDMITMDDRSPILQHRVVTASRDGHWAARSNSIRSHGVSVDNIEDLEVRHRAILTGRLTSKFLFQLAASIRGESADRVCRNLAGRSSILVRVVPRRILGSGHVLWVTIWVHESHLIISRHVVAVHERVL